MSAPVRSLVPLLLLVAGACAARALAPPPASPPRPATQGTGGAPVSGDAGATAGAGGEGGSPRPGLPPLVGAEELVALEVAGHAPAVVSLPLGATAPRPVLVATHGNYDRPEWTCAIWRGVVGNDGFVLCPRGVRRDDAPRRDDAHHYLSNLHLEREIEQALASLEVAYAGYVSPPPHAYAGFSQGAIMGVAILGRHPEWFDRAVLIEGGFDRWSKAGVARYAAGGGRRVLFACGQWDCEHGGQALRPWFEAVGVEVRVVLAKGAGHTYGGAVADELAASFAWFVADDPRWRASP